MEFKHVIVALACLAVLAEAATWDYGDNGPDKWGDSYPDCKKSSQSPIDISTSGAVNDTDLEIVDRMLFFNPPTRMTIQNNGHALVMNIDEGAYEINVPGLLPFTAVLAQYHFHWASSKDKFGSEHLIDGKQYFGELHAVHYNKKYQNIQEAIDKPDGLAVFGWFIDIGYPQTNFDFANFLTVALNGAKYASNSTNVAGLFSLETLLPPGLDVYYRYSGSLTTPACYESVTWTVFKEPIYVHEDQAQTLATMFYSDDGGHILNDNFRPIQPLNGRQITVPPRLVKAGAGAVRPTIFVTLLTFLMGYFM